MMDDRIIFLGSAYALRDSGVTGPPARFARLLWRRACGRNSVILSVFIRAGYSRFKEMRAGRGKAAFAGR